MGPEEEEMLSCLLQDGFYVTSPGQVLSNGHSQVLESVHSFHLTSVIGVIIKAIALFEFNGSNTSQKSWAKGKSIGLLNSFIIFHMPMNLKYCYKVNC